MNRPSTHGVWTQTVPMESLTALDAEGGKRKRRRKRKQPVTATGAEEATAPPSEVVEIPISSSEGSEPVSDEEKSLIDEIAKFEFKADDDVLPPPDLSSTEASAAPIGTDSTIPLPDIKESLKRKALEEELAKMEQEAEAKKVKIKRSDKAALAKLLEMDPYADSDDSFFEEEEYGTVSALLGERAKPFLGIPSGPLQIGHFIGALGIILMAFIEYPGFPLTNLPTPLREALQGGLATIYTINIGLAVYAVFKATERGQSPLLWGVKTFSVGGLALDQLTQLPTLEQIKEAESRKGARALKKNKRS